MNPEVKQEWLTRLRSGDYKQGRGRLKINHNGLTKHCCFGVLCEIGAEKNKVKEFKGHDGNIYFGSGDSPILWRMSYPPDLLVDWAGLGYQELNYLVEMNDTGKTFEEIAQHIEDNL